MSAVLITGSCGLVGSEASKFFCEKGFDVIGVDNNYRKYFFLFTNLYSIYSLIIGTYRKTISFNIHL